MPGTTFSLSAALVSGKPETAGLRIEAWDAEGICPDLIDVAVTDARGAFEMRVDGRNLAELLPRRRPAVVFRVFDAQGRVVPLEKQVEWRIAQQRTRLQIPLAQAGASERTATTGRALSPSQLAVRGTVRRADGSPMSGVQVRAFDRNLGRAGFDDTELGAARTDADGRYEIRYSMPAGGKVKPDLIVLVGAPSGGVVETTTAGGSTMGGPAGRTTTTAPRERPRTDAVGRTETPTLAAPGDTAPPALRSIESELLTSAPATAIVDLGPSGVSRPTPSEYRRTLARLDPFLQRGVALAELEPAALAYAAQAARVRLDRARKAQQAALLEQEVGATTRTAASDLSAEIWYGLLRMGYSGGLAQVARTPLRRLRNRLQRAIKARVISRTYRARLDAIVGALRELTVARELPAETRGGGAISTLLRHSLAPRETQAAFLSRWLDRRVPSRTFWRSIRTDATLGPSADDLETTIRLAMLFDGNTRALADLRIERQAGRVTSLRTLARWEDADWQSFVTRIGGPPDNVAGATTEERTQSWLARIRRQLGRFYPSEIVRRNARRTRPALGTQWVAALVAANPDLDPRQPLPDSLAWGDIPEADREAARSQWTSFRREALAFRHVSPTKLLALTTATGGQNPIRTAAASVLDRATDLDLETEGVEAYLARKSTALDTVDAALHSSVIGHLKATQRLLRVTQEPDATDTLLEAGLDSAMRITRMPRTRFIARYSSALGGESQARQIYNRACSAANTAQLALTHTGQCLLGTDTAATRTRAETNVEKNRQSALDLLKSKAVPAESDADTPASWPVLFGAQAWCECEDCQSVYSPAAYLVDLLHMLDPDDDQDKPANFLFKRRPDLLHLKLTCENTNTTIPCVDLVNEILETYIAADLQDKPALRGRSRNTTEDDTAEQLRAEPRYVNDAVYRHLADQVYPFTLPFHRPLATVRTYLEQLGTSYRDVLEAFGPADGSTQDDLTAAERLAAESLGLSALAFHLVAGTSGRSTQACYGFADNDTTWTSTIAQVPELLRRTGVTSEELMELLDTAFVDPSESVSLETPVAGVIDDTTVLGASSDTWDRLHRFIRLWRASGWSMDEVDLVLAAVCDPALDRDALRRVGRVKELAETTIERPIAALVSLWADVTDWDEDLLALFGQPIADQIPAVLAAFRISDTDLGLVWDHAAAAGLVDRETETISNRSLTELYRYAVLAKGIGMRIADLITLLTLTGLDPFTARRPEATQAFTELATLVEESGVAVGTLDYVYRHTINPAQGPAPADSTVSQALGKVWSALRSVRQETQVVDDPDGTLLAARLALVHPPEIVSTIMDALDPAKGLDDATRAQIFTDHLAAYLTSDVDALLVPALPADAEEEKVVQRRLDNQALVLAELSAWLRDSLSRAAVVAVVAETLALSAALTSRLLNEWISGDATTLDTFLALAGGGLTVTPVDAPATVSMQVTTTSTPRTVTWSGRLLPLGDGEHTFVLRTNGAVTLTIDEQTFSWPASDSVVDRVADPPITLVANTLVDLTVTYDAGTAAGSVDLLWKLSSSPSSVPVPPENLYPTGTVDLDGADVGPGFTWRRMHKAALLIAGLALTEDELDYAEASLTFAGFRLRDLPMSADEPTAMHMQRFRVLAEYTAVRDELPDAETTLVDVFRARTPRFDDATTPAERNAAFLAHWAEQLCEATGWDAAAVESLFDRDVLTPNDARPLHGDQILATLLTTVAGPPPAERRDLAMGRRLAALSRCLELVRRIGVAARPHGLFAWARREPDAQTAADVVLAVHGRYEEDADWLEVARTRNDPLREASRDALVAWLLQQPIIDDRAPIDADELFEFFLIDVQMAATFQTSRIKQAISSVQLFVQRILLGLEQPDIAPDAIDSDRWQWISRYRVWEADRKIFLYPENWIEPELREGKSPFFEELESALKQGPLEDTNVEDAFLGYLYRLDEVARLRVCAVCWEESEGDDEESDDDDVDVLHVVARSLTVPPSFWYRQLVNRTEWTAWKRIDLDIEADGETGNVAMAMTVFERRLYLFWALFTEKPESEQPASVEGELPPPPLTHWDIRMAWSTYRDGAWSPKQVSTKAIVSDRFDADQFERDQLEQNLEEAEGDWNDAENAVLEAEEDLWKALKTLRDELYQRIAQYVLKKDGDEEWTREDYDAKDTDTVNYVEYAGAIYRLGLFPDWLESLAGVEDWMPGTFDDFIDAIYAFPEDGTNLTPYLLSADPDALSSAYDQLTRDGGLRDDKTDAKTAFDTADTKLTDFDLANGPVAIPDQREREDHSIWISADDELVVWVLRETADDKVEKIGSFTLSDDSRSLDAEQLDEPKTKDVSDVSPEHSEMTMNGFRVEVSDSGDAGLDFSGLENLLATVDEPTFYGERNFDAEISSTSPRPFFLAQDSEVHVALPVPPTPAAHGFMVTEPIASDYLARGTAEKERAFGVEQFDLTEGASASDRAKWLGNVPSTPCYSFDPFHHPFTRSLIKRLNAGGVDRLLLNESQNPDGDDHGEAGGHFDEKFSPSTSLVSTFSPYDIDFRAQGPYALYNWELFFHAPFLVALRLMQDQRYEEARDWFHQIFDPTTDSTDSDAPTRYWKLQPFRDNDDYASAEQMLTALADPAADPALAATVQAQIDQWKRYPADPHRIAQLRVSAYQKAVVLRYLDNLIAWGDSLFAQDTIESINEATQLYILASHLLGPRPEEIPSTVELEPLDYAAMRGGLDALSNLLVDVEGLISYPSTKGGADNDRTSTIRGMSHLGTFKGGATEEETEEPPQVLYFCVPGNDNLLSYWDTIEDRLFKIRHCMNLAGVERQLALFEPPLDPALLVRAAAAGLDIGSVLADLSAPLPHHRFPFMLQKAVDLTNEVKSLGAQLLAALEKKDGEQIALLRATHEKAILTAMRDVRDKQLAEAQANKLALEKTRATVQTRYDYYSSREDSNSWEDAQVAGILLGGAAQAMGGLLMLSSAAAGYTLPDIETGSSGMGAHSVTVYGGEHVGSGLATFAQGASILGQGLQTAASIAGIMGAQERRMDDWMHQADLATKELAQIDQQLVAADIRIELATLEQANLEKQIDNAAAIEEVLRSKYTNEELYSWMITRVSELYYQAYKLAYDLAKRAERCYRFETGVTSSSFVQFGYWDSLRKGLLAGEQLSLALRRLDAAYLEAARRDYEITRQVSLVLHNPGAFMDLRETGSCEVDLPEELFDADYLGHYFRRLKTVSLTLPCVAGPYTPINCTLTLLSNRVRTSSSAAGEYPERDTPNDPRFACDFGAVESVATSHGQNDAGLFEVSFRDERYLPFEGAGAISKWRIDLPKESNAFDFDTLSDVILRVSYTARDGGKPLADAARKSLADRRAEIFEEDGTTPPPALQRLFRVRYEMSDEWIAFRNAGGSGALALDLGIERFPYLFRGKTIAIDTIVAYLTLTDDEDTDGFDVQVSTPGNGSPGTLSFAQSDSDGTVLASTSWSGIGGETGQWSFTPVGTIPIDRVKDLFLLVTYAAS